MSNAIWQMSRRKKLYKDGDCPTSRAEIYIKTWANKCYFDGIPDEVQSLLQESGRAPSYKAIAECILKSDLMFHGLGFSVKDSDIVNQLKRNRKSRESNQLELELVKPLYKNKSV